MPNDTEAAAPAPVQNNELTIQGLKFSAPQRYNEGHVLTAQEARQLQQTFKEALRNNFASTIKKSLDTAKVKEPKELSEDAQAQLALDFEAYAAKFEFAARSGGTRVQMDPVEREFQKLGTPVLKAALAKKGMDYSQLTDDQKAQLFEKLKAAKPDIWALAERRVADTKALATEALEF